MSGSSFIQQPGVKQVFWLVNIGLVLLFIFSLGEQTAVSIQVSKGKCTAIVPERQLAIECPRVEGGEIGLFYRVADDRDLADFSLWQLLMPDSAWYEVIITGGSSLKNQPQSYKVTDLPGGQVTTGSWRSIFGELQPTAERAVILWPNPVDGDFRLQATLRRSFDPAGILILEPGGEKGWAFIISGQNRQGVWWRWEGGQGRAVIAGIPFQRPLAVQALALVRNGLLSHQVALLLLVGGLLFTKLLRLILPWLNRQNLPSKATSTQNRGWVCSYRPEIFIIFAVWLVFGAAVYIAIGLLERLPHVQDSITYLFQAQVLAKGQLTAPAPTLPGFFEQEFLLVQDGHWFGKYPPGFPLLLALGVILKAPWLINPFLAALSIPLLFVLGKGLFNRTTGILAVFLALVSPFFLIMSGTFMAHSAELFWILLFMVAWVHSLPKNSVKGSPNRLTRGGRFPRLGWALVAGVALGMILLTRQLTAFISAVPFMFLTLIFLAPKVPWRQRLKGITLSVIPAAIFGLLLLGHQWAVTGSPGQDPRLLFWDFDHLGFGQDIGQGQNYFRLDTVEGEPITAWLYDPSQPARGHTLQRGLYNLGLNIRHLQQHLFGWLPLVTLAFIWLLFVSGRATRADWLLLGTMAISWLAYVFYWADGIMYGPRYFYATLPALFLLTARGILMLAALLQGRIGQWLTAVLIAALIIGNLSLYLPNALTDLKNFNFIGRESLTLVESSVQKPALIFVKERTADWWEYGNYFNGNTPWLDGQIIYARDLGDRENARLQELYPERVPYRLTPGEPITLERMESTD